MCVCVTAEGNKLDVRAELQPRHFSPATIKSSSSSCHTHSLLSCHLSFPYLLVSSSPLLLVFFSSFLPPFLSSLPFLCPCFLPCFLLSCSLFLTVCLLPTCFTAPLLSSSPPPRLLASSLFYECKRNSLMFYFILTFCLCRFDLMLLVKTLQHNIHSHGFIIERKRRRRGEEEGRVKRVFSPVVPNFGTH